MYIFIKSFEAYLRHISKYFKRSKIIPIFKSGDSNDINNDLLI